MCETGWERGFIMGQGYSLKALSGTQIQAVCSRFCVLQLQYFIFSLQRTNKQSAMFDCRWQITVTRDNYLPNFCVSIIYFSTLTILQLSFFLCLGNIFQNKRLQCSSISSVLSSGFLPTTCQWCPHSGSLIFSCTPGSIVGRTASLEILTRGFSVPSMTD